MRGGRGGEGEGEEGERAGEGAIGGGGGGEGGADQVIVLLSWPRCKQKMCTFLIRQVWENFSFFFLLLKNSAKSKVPCNSVYLGISLFTLAFLCLPWHFSERALGIASVVGFGLD
jgi:hypothetical protein